MKKGAIFDMDGLLFDTERVYREEWQKTAKVFGQEYDPAFHLAVCGTSGQLMRDVVKRYYPGVDEDAFVRYCMERMEERLVFPVEEKPGVHEILDFFREKNVRMAVASSSAGRFIEGNLRNAGIREYFEVVVSGDQVKRGKPEPDIFLAAAERLGLAPKDCYVFEDGINGVKAGARAGCATVMIPDLIEPNDEVRSLCVGVYDSLTEALRQIRRAG